MSRPLKNMDQIRSLLQRMDRSIEDARGRREGSPADPRAATPGSPTSPESNLRPSHPFPASPIRPQGTPNGPSSGNGARPNGSHGPQSPNGSNGPGFSRPSPSNGNGSSNGPAQPARLKAKAKRPGSNDGLQDFQQRQAS
jgi:hypothetical protein